MLHQGRGSSDSVVFFIACRAAITAAVGVTTRACRKICAHNPSRCRCMLPMLLASGRGPAILFKSSSLLATAALATSSATSSSPAASTTPHARVHITRARGAAEEGHLHHPLSQPLWPSDLCAHRHLLHLSLSRERHHSTVTASFISVPPTDRVIGGFSHINSLLPALHVLDIREPHSCATSLSLY